MVVKCSELFILIIVNTSESRVLCRLLSSLDYDFTGVECCGTFCGQARGRSIIITAIFEGTSGQKSWVLCQVPKYRLDNLLTHT